MTQENLAYAGVLQGGRIDASERRKLDVIEAINTGHFEERLANGYGERTITLHYNDGELVRWEEITKRSRK